jgi:hypothetical protein
VAFDCGLDIYTQDEDKNECLWIMAGLHADIETLAVLHECGMQFSDTVVRAAALSGRLDVLQHLITCNASVRRPTGSAITLLAAAASACLNG